MDRSNTGWSYLPRMQETRVMRKEVKRSLILWPAVASAAITGMSLLTTIDGTKLDRIQARSVSLISHVVAMHSSIAPPRPNVELAVRSECGVRAMKLPDRVAEVYGVERGILKAPVCNEERELAGLVLQPQRHVGETVLSHSVAMLSGDVLAADRIAADETIATDRAIGASTLQSLRNRVHMEPINRPPAFVGPIRPQPSQPEIVALGTSELPEVSLLPASNRVLGKRILMQPSAERTMATDETAPSIAQSAQADLAINVDSTTAGDMVSGDATVENQLPGEKSPAGWPLTRRLDEQLESLSLLTIRDRSGSRDQAVSHSNAAAPVVRWSDDVSRTLHELQSLPRLGDPQAAALIDRLSELADDGERRAEELDDRDAQVQWLRASHAIARRVAVWRPVWQITNGNQTTWMVSDEVDERRMPVADAVKIVRADLGDSGDSDGWARYLLLDEIENAAQPGQIEQRNILAQRFLSRLEWHGLDPEHRRWLEREPVTQLALAVQPWACRAVDYANLLSQLERQESDAIDIAAIEIADTVQTLRFAESTQAVAVADAIDTYYRNANVRLAISELMLKRLLPTIDPQSVPVRTQVFGSQVRGTSRIESDLDVELKPSPDRWSLELKTHGKVSTQSTGINGAVAVRTAGKSGFVAATPIDVTERGVTVGGSEVEVQGRTKLRGIRTDYDGWPLIGSLARSIAADRYDSLAGRSNRIANQTIESQVGKKIENQVDERLGEATDQVSRMVLGPLGKLELDPKVMDMQTTEQRLLARYRLAGDWQLGAFTPRPRALSSSLMSVQVHQSALNNTLEQLVPKDHPVTIRRMLIDAADMFGQGAIDIPADIPDDVSIQFAPTRPITVEIEDGTLWVTLRVIRLNRGERVDLTQFIVRAAYKPEIDGLNAMLVRDGHLRISGPGMSMRERLPVRAIFNKVLSPNRPFQLTLPQLIQHPAMENLAVSQLELRGGWIGLAISKDDAPRIATGNSNKNNQ